MTSFLDHHGSYDPATGLFAAKRDADEVAGKIRVFMSRYFINFNPLSVVVEGKKNQYHVFFPRLRLYWHPAKADVRTIASELAMLGNEFASIYELKGEGNEEANHSDAGA